MIGTSDQSCWLAEACKILLLSIVISLVGWPKLVKFYFFFFFITKSDKLQGVTQWSVVRQTNIYIALI